MVGKVQRARRSRKWRVETGNGSRLSILKTPPLMGYTSSHKALPPKVSITFPKSSTNWGPCVQVPVPAKNILIQTTTLGMLIRKGRL